MLDQGATKPHCSALLGTPGLAADNFERTFHRWDTHHAGSARATYLTPAGCFDYSFKGKTLLALSHARSTA